MSFKWTLSRPGIELEFETGNIKEAIGLLEEEGTQISEVFGFTMGAHQGEQAAPDATDTKPPRKPRINKAATEAVAPPPLALPAPAATVTTLPPNALPAAPPPPPSAPDTAPTTNGIPAFLDRTTAPPPVLPSPPTVPSVTPPPVGVLGPKVVKALDLIRDGKPDGGAALSDWLAATGLTQKGAAYDDACRAVLMISDEKLKGVADALGVK